MTEATGTWPPLDEVPASSSLRHVLQQDTAVSLFVHSFQVWSTGFSFALRLAMSPQVVALVGPGPIELRGQAPVGEEDRVVEVTVRTRSGASLANTSSRDDETLVLLNGRGMSGWCEARYWVPGPIRDEIELSVAWPLASISCATMIQTTLLQKAQADVVPFAWKKIV